MRRIVDGTRGDPIRDDGEKVIHMVCELTKNYLDRRDFIYSVDI
jgi:hypothetical protein